LYQLNYEVEEIDFHIEEGAAMPNERNEPIAKRDDDHNYGNSFEILGGFGKMGPIKLENFTSEFR
jgi:hypothetical protein